MVAATVLLVVSLKVMMVGATSGLLLLMVVTCGEGDGRRGYRAVGDGRRAEACCDYSAEGVETSMHFSHAYYAEVSQLIKKQWFDTRLILCFHFKCFHFICVSNFISFV